MFKFAIGCSLLSALALAAPALAEAPKQSGARAGKAEAAEFERLSGKYAVTRYVVDGKAMRPCTPALGSAISPRRSI